MIFKKLVVTSNKLRIFPPFNLGWLDFMIRDVSEWNFCDTILTSKKLVILKPNSQVHNGKNG